MKDDKRKDVIGWDAYFLGLAALASFRSKDPSTQNGACVVDPISLNVLALGYNGFPRGCDDDDDRFPWVREATNQCETKFPYVEHAERNAIYGAVKKGVSLDGAHMYIYSEKGYYSCDECTRAIIQSGIKKVIMSYAIKDNTDKYNWTATKRMYEASGVNLEIICRNDCSDRARKLVNDFQLINFKMGLIKNKLDEEAY